MGYNEMLIKFMMMMKKRGRQEALVAVAITRNPYVVSTATDLRLLDSKDAFIIAYEVKII